MTTTPDVPGARTGRHRHRSEQGWSWWLARVIGAVTVAAVALAVVLHEMGWRDWEAWLAGHVTSWFTGATPYTVNSTFYVDVHRPDVFGLRVTAECTSAMIVTGLLGLTAILMLVTRLPLRRLTFAAALSAGMFYLINITRLLVIALSTRQWGLDTGFYWSHIWAGTVITVFGAATVLGLYLFTIGTVGHRTATTGATA